MPSLDHEALVDLFRHRPSMALSFLTEVLGDETPRGRVVQVADSDLSQLAPPEYHADLVLRLEDDDGRCLWAVVVEVQLAKRERKRWVWPAYACIARSQWECPALLLVITPDRGVATWAAEPIRLGGASAFQAVVVGPDDVPRISDPDVAQAAPELAVLSAVVHRDAPDPGPVLLAGALGAQAVAAVDDERAAVYYDLVTRGLASDAARALERLMGLENYRFQSDFALKYIGVGRAEGKAEGRAEGKAEGKAEAILTVLEARGFAIPAALADRIRACTDPEQIDRWLRRAATVSSADEVLDDA